METFSALLAICAGNSPVPGEVPAQRPVARSFDVFFDLRLNKRLSKQSWRWWYETLSSPLWRYCSVSWNDLFNGCRIVFIIGVLVNVTGLVEIFFHGSRGSVCLTLPVPLLMMPWRLRRLGRRQQGLWSSFEGVFESNEPEKLRQLICQDVCTRATMKCFNTLRPRQIARHFADDIFKCMFMNVFWFKFLNKSALVQVMAWRRTGDKPLSEPMMV